MPRSTFFTLCQRFLFTYELYKITIITQDFIITSQLFIYIYISIPSLLLSIWSFYVSKKAYELLADNTRSEEELRDAYYSTPCLCV